jgi:cation transporter-like permease
MVSRKELEVLITARDELSAVIDKTGNAAAAAGAKFSASATEIMAWGQKVNRVGAALTQNVTFPIVGIGTAAVKMSFDILKSKDAIDRMSNEGKLKMAELWQATKDTTDAYLNMKIVIAEAVAPAISDLINNQLNPLIDRLTQIIGKWGEQSESMKESQIITLALVATAGPVIQWSASIVTAAAAATIAFGAVGAAATLAMFAIVGLVAAWIYQKTVMANFDPTAVSGPGPEGAALRAAVGSMAGGTGMPSESRTADAIAKSQADLAAANMLAYLNSFNRDGTVGRGGGGGGGVPVISGAGIGPGRWGAELDAARATAYVEAHKFVEGAISELWSNTFVLPRSATMGGQAFDFMRGPWAKPWTASREQSFQTWWNSVRSINDFDMGAPSTKLQQYDLRGYWSANQPGLGVYGTWQEEHQQFRLPDEWKRPGSPEDVDSIHALLYRPDSYYELPKYRAPGWGYIPGEGGFGYKKGPGKGAVPIWQRNDWLWGAGIQAANVATGQADWTSMLPIVGSAFGPVGAAVGGVLASIFGGKQKQRGNDPANPLYVKDINTGSLITELMNLTKSLLARTGSGVIDRLASDLRMQTASRGLA